MLDEIKMELKISGNDEDVNLQRYLKRGKGVLQELTGTEINFEKEGTAKSLLFSYVRYEYNNASEYFLENFQREITGLIISEGVSNHVKTKEVRWFRCRKNI